MLTDKQVKNAKPKEKPYKLTDQKGLYLYVLPSGFKSWRYDYKSPVTGKRPTYVYGEYPYISLAEARELHIKVKSDLSKGIDPQVEKKAQKQAEQAKESNNFKVVALEWFEYWKQKNKKAESTIKSTWQLLNKNVLPFPITKKQINEVIASDVLEVLSFMEKNGRYETLQKVKSILSQIFCYGVVTCRCQSDLTSGFKGHFKTSDTVNFVTLSKEEDIKQFLLDLYQAPFNHKHVSLLTLSAIKLILHTAVRNQEACLAEWKEFDFIKNVWTIPAEHKKERREFKVPLSRQVIAILNELRPFTEETGRLFPSLRSKQGYISEDSLSKFIRETLGYRGKQTIHGFRAMFSTVNNEKEKFSRDIIDSAIAHKIGNAVSSIYNRAEYMKQRQELMQDWSDYLDDLRTK